MAAELINEFYSLVKELKKKKERERRKEKENLTYYFDIKIAS